MTEKNQTNIKRPWYSVRPGFLVALLITIVVYLVLAN